MGVYNVKNIIREARLKVGLTQEQVSEGICTVQMFSKIETGRAEVNYDVFIALMERIGEGKMPTEMGMWGGFSPAFADREECKVFCTLKYSEVYLDSWQLDAAYEELQKIADSHWLGEPLYCQEWLMLQCRIQFCSCTCDHEHSYDLLLHALHITRPKVDLRNIQSLLLTQNEIRVLTALAQEAVYLGKLDETRKICGQVSDYLENTSIWPERDMARLQAETDIVYTKYLIAKGDVVAAFKTVDAARHKMAGYEETAQLLELTFLAGLCCWQMGDRETASSRIKAAFYTAQALESCYAIPWVAYLEAETDYPLTERMRSLLGASLAEYPIVEWQYAEDRMKQFKGRKKNSFTIGNLIRELRLEQGLSQLVLCRGLCSKSMLSKIEHGFREPKIMLTSVLLQRLGLSDQLFSFYESAQNAKFFDLKFKISYDNTTSKEIAAGWLKEMETLAEKKGNRLYYQEYLHIKAIRLDAAEEKIALLLEALHITLPDFDIHKICDYRLSRCELNILNDIALAYRLTEESHLCMVYYSQIQAYVRAMDLDILMKMNVLPFSDYEFIRTYYLKNYIGKHCSRQIGLTYLS